MMLGRKPKRIRRPRREILERLSEAFREIEAHFELLGFSSPEEEEPQHAEAQAQRSETKKEAAEAQEVEEHEVEEYDGEEGEELDDRYGEDEVGASVYDREEIEVAIDVFISELVREGLMPEPRPRTTPDIADVFEKFFGEDHEIIKLARDLDEHIEGYFGAIGYDDMNAAYGEVMGIRDIIQKEIQRYAQK
jgi:hypothetical protein